MENEKPKLKTELPDFDTVDAYVKNVIAQVGMTPDDIKAPEWSMHIHQTTIGQLVSYTSIQGGQLISMMFDMESAIAYSTRFLQLQAGAAN